MNTFRKPCLIAAIAASLALGAGVASAGEPHVHDPVLVVHPPHPVVVQPVVAVPVVPATQVITVDSHPGNSISSNYRIDPVALDRNGDGVLTRAEIGGNPDLQREFHVVDLDNNGRLTPFELKDWVDPIVLE